MSRGLGKVQQTCRDVLADEGALLDSIEIAGRALHKEVINDSEHASFRRALRKLADCRMVVDMGRGFRHGRRCWALPDAAKRYFDDDERCFGKQAATKARARAKFTAERFPDHA
jgi:hypothetical protein